MTAVRTVKRGGSRFYHDPVTRVTLPGVTSILRMVPKPYIARWEAGMAAELAADSLTMLPELLETGGRQAVVDYLRYAAPRYSKARADVGTEVHDIAERMLRGEAVGRQRSDIEPYRVNFAEFLDKVQPEMVDAENIVWSATHGYAGSFDASMLVKVSADSAGKPVLDPAGGTAMLTMGDWKTGSGTYPEVALQLSAYENADFVIRPDGTRYDTPEFELSLVLHLTDTQWSLKPVDTGPEVFNTFLALRKLFDWDRDLSKDVIGRPIATGGSGAIITGSQRRGR